MRMTCANCGLTLGLMEALYDGVCRDTDECLTRMMLAEGPPLVTWHPDSLPPDDLDQCAACVGLGIIYQSDFPDWETGARPRVECVVCGGTGKRVEL